MAGIDARLYSRAESQMPVESLAGAGTAGQESYTPPERNIPVNTIGAGEASLIGEQVRQGASLVEPNRLAALGATFMQMPIADAYAWLTKPEHDPDTKDSPTFNDVLQRIPFELTEAEYTKLKEAPNYGDRQWYVDRFTEKRETARVAGEYPLQHFAASVGLDPTTYVSAFGAFQVGKLAQAAKASTAVARTAAAATSGVIETSVNVAGSQVNPMSTGEMFLTTLAATAGGATMVRGGKIVQADPDLPMREMQESLGKPHMRMVSPAEYIDEATAGSAEVVQDISVAMDKSLRGAKPRYGYKDQNFSLQFASDIERAAYIVAGSGKSVHHEEYLKFIKDATGLQDAEIIALGQHVRSTVKAQAKTATGDTLQVGKLYNGDVKTMRTVVTPATPGSISRRKVKDAVWEEIPMPLREGASASPQEVALAVEQVVDKQVQSWGKSFGETMAWNVHKSLRKLSSAGDETADLFVDNQAKYGITSVESEKAAIMRDLGTHQWAYEDAFRAELANRGHGTLKQLWASGDTRQASAALEEAIKREHLRRDTFIRQGKEITPDGIDPAVFKLANLYDNATGASLDEMQAAKVFGADGIKKRPGYFTRVHSADRMEAVLDELKAAGMTEDKARRQLVNMYRGSVRRANPGMEAEVADDIAGALVDRTLRKGRLEDSPRNTMYGSDTAAEVRDILKGAGISGDRLQRALDAMVGVVDEQGKAGYLKHRIDLDYTASMVVNGRTVSVADMIEGNMNTLLDTYLHGVAAKTAFARKGILKQGDLLRVRNKYIQGATDKEAARDLFDNMVAHLEGRPTGEKMTEFMRNAGMYSRMITLGSSAVWQATEYATMAHRYGYLKTFKYAMAEMPLFKNLMETAAHDKVLSRELKDVLTNQADQNIRLRPFIGKFEDNFAMPKDSQLATAARQGAQMVPYVNGMKLIHGHQARVQANLIMEVMRKASHGDVKARDLLRGYGIEQHGMDKLSTAMKTHGTAVDKWDAATWRAVRPALTKMVDEGVLHARLGDMPAYAMFSQTGKFIFQYRSFVLSAHNKILSGTASRHGLGAVALMSMYQFPLAMMATQANEVLTGRKPLETDALIVKSIGQMGSLGLMTEMWNWLSGTKREVGAPGLIPFDRTIRAASSASSAMFGEGTAGQAAKDSLSLAPILGVAPGFKMLGSLLVPKE